jgi:hypothetical protein
MVKFNSWGVLYNSTMYYAADHECRCWNNMFGIDFQHMVPMLVGLDTGSCRKGGKVGALIFRCDLCFDYFWFHGSEVTVEFFKEQASQWPK